MAATKQAAKKAPAKPAKSAAKKTPAKRASKKPVRRTPKKRTDLIAFTAPPARATGKVTGRPIIGDPSCLDPSRTNGQLIVDFIYDGYPPITAAGMTGVHKTTLNVWMARGTAEWARVAGTGEPIAEAEAPYVALVQEIEHAKAAATAEKIDDLKRMSRTNHVAAQVYLGYLDPEFAPKPARMELTGANGGPVRTAIELPTIGDAERKVAELEAAHADQLRQGVIDVQSREAS